MTSSKSKGTLTFKRGQSVVTTEEIRDISWSVAIPIGAKGVLQDFHRTQEGVELWSMWLSDFEFQPPPVRDRMLKSTGKRLLCVTSDNIKVDLDLSLKAPIPSSSSSSSSSRRRKVTSPWLN